jgi:hypothetical protein
MISEGAHGRSHNQHLQQQRGMQSHRRIETSEVEADIEHHLPNIGNGGIYQN